MTSTERLGVSVVVDKVVAMHPDPLFVYTLQELEDRTKRESDEYNVLMSALPLRKLLLGQPLIHTVNRERRVPVVFRIVDYDDYVNEVMKDNPVFYATLEGLSPRLLGSSKYKEVNLDGLLAIRVMQMSGVDVTVRDVISQVANIEGAVHLGHPQDEKESLLHEVDAHFSVTNVGCVTRSLVGIAAVVCDGLLPLMKRVLADLGYKLPASPAS